MRLMRSLAIALTVVLPATSLSSSARAQDSALHKATQPRFHMMVYYLVLLRSGPNAGAGDSTTRAQMFADPTLRLP